PRRVRRTPRGSWPPPSWFPSPRSIPSRCRSRERPSREALQRFAVLLRGARDDVSWELRRRRLLVPVERLEVIAHELLVVGGRGDADAVRIPGPEARGVGREHLVDQDELVLCVQPEFELGVRNDDPARGGVLRGLLVEPDADVADLAREVRSD